MNAVDKEFGTSLPPNFEPGTLKSRKGYDMGRKRREPEDPVREGTVHHDIHFFYPYPLPNGIAE